ncbi:MAG: hypothetical protein RBU27_06225 [Bacteroidota bacterium]|jgi:hypothetical protein|nr:hypothetical protein [Bacteroidota bacterium]
MRIRAFLFAVLSLMAGPLLSQTTIVITDSVLQQDVRRFGINVGARSWWGAAQHIKNLIDNPGFEAGDFASIILVDDGATATSVPMANWDVAWNNEQYGIGWPEGFWTGAEYEILWGNANGRRGVVTGHGHAGGRHVFDLDGSGPAPQRMSVMLLRRRVAGVRGSTAAADPGEKRPGSPGVQSMKLTAGGINFRQYMDSYWRDGDRSAGKLLVINGTYQFRIWAKAARDGDRLRVRFHREGEGSFLDETVSLTTQWQHVERIVTVPDGADPLRVYSDGEYHPILAFELDAEGNGAEVWVDDVELHAAADANPTAFTDRYVDRLRELHPGVLRFWGAQLGARFESQIAPPHARRTSGWSPQGRMPNEFSYSLHEFLELCAFVGADPWYVMPPTFSPDEIAALVEYLAAPANEAHPWARRRAALGRTAPWTEAFARVHIEFGNEMWGSGGGGDPFMGSSVNGGERLGAIAHDRFSLMRGAPFFDANVMRLVIGGQAGYAGRQREIQQNASAHDAVALAPYFGILDTWATDEEIYGPLFAMPFQEVARGRMRESRGYLDEDGKTDMSIYEINYHTTHGNAPIDIRNDFLTGMGGALALPLSMLVYQRDLGAIDQCAFSSLGFSFRLENGEYARLWGMLRDVAVTGRKRPTWLGIELVNKAVMGYTLLTQQTGNIGGWMQPPINGIDEPIAVRTVQSFAFAEGGERSIVLFNLRLDTPCEVELRLREPSTGSAMLYQLASASIHDNNEDSVMVRIDSMRVEDFNDGHALTLPPHSVHVLRWTAAPISVRDETLPLSLELGVWQSARGMVTIRAGLPPGEDGYLEIRDLLGRRVDVPAGVLEGGRMHSRHWRAPAAGVYFVVLRTAWHTRTAKIMLLDSE